MWKKNLFFVGLCLAGIVGIGASLAPAKRPAHWDGQPALTADHGSFRKAVDAVNASFRSDWTDKQLVPAVRASDLAIARRASLALTGTIPSLEEIRMLEARPASGRIDWWVGGLLKDRRGSDYMAERLARAYVGVVDGPFLVYRRRRLLSWLTEELQANRPYDQLVRSLIATDGVWTDQPATNFVTVAVKPDSEEGVDENVLASRVSRAFLGIRLDCAECHDHPFQPEWQQSDFQGLAAYFGQVDLGTKGAFFSGVRDNASSFYQVQDAQTLEQKTVPPAVPFQANLLPKSGPPRQQLAGWVTHPDNKMFARAAVNRAWALMFGRPLVEPVDDLPIDGEYPPAIEVLAQDFVANGHDLRRLFQMIAATEVFQLDSASGSDEEPLTEAHEAAWASFPITRLRSEQVVGGLLQSASLETIDYESHILVRLARANGQSEFVKRYGDAGENEFSERGGTIPQRLLLMNGDLVREKTKENYVANAATRIALLAPTDEKAVEIAYLTTLTRRPTADESAHFRTRLDGSKAGERNARMEDLYWSLINATEFSWNH